MPLSIEERLTNLETQQKKAEIDSVLKHVKLVELLQQEHKALELVNAQLNALKSYVDKVVDALSRASSKDSSQSCDKQ